MSELHQFYVDKAKAVTRSLPAMQAEALAAFERIGFPTRKDEDWKYTRVEALLKNDYEPASRAPANQAVESFQNAITITILNAQIQVAALPAGLVICSLQEALANHPEKVKRCLNQVLQTEHAFHAQNTAMLQQGVFIYLPKNLVLEQPILLVHRQDGDKQAVYLRHVIVAESGVEASVIEDYQGNSEQSYFTNTVTEVLLESNASLTHYKVQREGLQALHIGHLAVKQKKDSSFSSHSLSLGAKLARSDTRLALVEPGARCTMNGLYLPQGEQHVDHHTRVDHLVSDCQSEQDYKGVLGGKARAVFNGKVVVAPNAQRTVANQRNKNLLLSMDAEVDTKPELDIYADDVRCTHGATVGQLDKEAVFYLQTRGLAEDEIKRFLIQGFITENIRKIANAPIAAWLEQLIEQQLR